MLEEALRTSNVGGGNLQQPEAAATMMLSFIQSDLLPAGGAPSGAAAEQRFFHLYGPLIDRIFGKIVRIPATVAGENNSTNNHAVDNKCDVEYRHEYGGWLSVENPWRSLASSYGKLPSSAPSPSRPRAPPSLDSDPVVKLLGGSLSCTIVNTKVIESNRELQSPPTLIEAISKESETRSNVLYSFPYHGLPASIQASWLQLVATSIAGKQHNSIQQRHPNQSTSSMRAICITENDKRLLATILRNSPLEQRELLQYLQYQASATLAAGKQVSESNSRQPFQSISPSNARTNLDAATKSNLNNGFHDSLSFEASDPNVMLDMLEYYLLVFVRFPVYPPLPGPIKKDSNRSGTIQPRETYGEALYYHIFKRYLRLFLPYDQETNSSAQIDNLNRSISFSGARTQTGVATTHSNLSLPVSSAQRESELFLRIMIALWLESPTRVLPTSVIVHSIEERRMKATGFSSSEVELNFDLDASFELVQTHIAYKYNPPSMQLKRCLRVLVVHAIIDPAVKTMIQKASHCKSDRKSENGSNSPSNSRHNTPMDWCLTPCMTALQLPIYNFIRATFREASIHTSESPFYVALNVWLLWLEPWNAIQVNRYSQSNRMVSTNDRRKTPVISYNINVPRVNDPNLFDKDPILWEPYVAANLYMYLIPLSIFLRRARELDFSANKFDKSLQTVKRVFRIFSPSLIQALHQCLAKQQRQPFISDLVSLHEENLGVYGPPSVHGSLSLSSLKKDMQSLLEEIDVQHVKKVRELDPLDRLVGWIEGWFGAGVVSGEERILDSLIERAKLIANVPMEYDFLPRSRQKKKMDSTSATHTDGEPKYRNQDGTLTDYGRQQLLLGAWSCDPSDVVPIGDPMLDRVQSYEIASLVTFTIFISNYLNELCQFHEIYKKYGIRFNLRFFADYRNLLFILLLLLIFKPQWLFKILI